MTVALCFFSFSFLVIVFEPAQDASLTRSASEVAALKQQTDALQRQIEAKTREVDTAQSAVDQHKAAVRERDTLIAELEKSVSGADAELTELRAKLERDPAREASASNLLAQVSTMRGQLTKAADTAASAATQQRQAEAETKSLRTELHQATERAERAEARARELKVSSAKGSAGRAAMSSTDRGKERQLEMYRRMVMCSVNTDQLIGCALTRCGHMFSKECITERIKSRNRRCPACGKPFGADDYIDIYFVG